MPFNNQNLAEHNSEQPGQKLVTLATVAEFGWCLFFFFFFLIARRVFRRSKIALLMLFNWPLGQVNKRASGSEPSVCPDQSLYKMWTLISN